MSVALTPDTIRRTRILVANSSDWADLGRNNGLRLPQSFTAADQHVIAHVVERNIPPLSSNS